MPIMTGVTATRILRERGYTLPIVAVTGNALAEDILAFREAGANDILVRTSPAFCIRKDVRPLSDVSHMWLTCGLRVCCSVSLDEAHQFPEDRCTN
jgi:CheY-like chemotaxis protein